MLNSVQYIVERMKVEIKPLQTIIKDHYTNRLLTAHPMLRFELFEAEATFVSALCFPNKYKSNIVHINFPFTW